MLLRIVSLIRRCRKSCVVYSTSSEQRIEDKLLSKERILRQCTGAIKKGRVKQVKTYILTYLRMCTTKVVFEKPEVKVKLAQALLDRCVNAGVQVETSMFNLLLHVHHQNNQSVSPLDIFSRMIHHRCRPDQMTLNLFIRAYCEQGRVDAAVRLMDYMMKWNFPVTEEVYAGIVMGHSRAGQLEEAEGVLESMKARNDSIGVDCYTSLLLAYAERGMMHKISETLEKMKVEGVSLTAQSYLSLMDSLSLHHHGAQVAAILPLLVKETHLPKDLRSLCYACLCRGEIEAPRIIMEHLSRVDAMGEVLLSYYIETALNTGQSMKAIVEQLRENMNLESFTHLPQIICRHVMFCHYNNMYTEYYKQQPTKGGLPPHPWGDRWITDAHYALNLLGGVKRLHPYHYLPLFARHCSDGNVKEAVKTLYWSEVNCGGAHHSKYIQLYIQKTFSNTGVSIQDYCLTQDAVESNDDLWLVQLFVFQLAYQMYSAAWSTFQRIKDRSALLPKRIVFFMLSKIHEVNWTDKDHGSLGVAMAECIPSSYSHRLFWVDDTLNKEILNRLLNKGVEIPFSDIIGHCQTLVRIRRLKQGDLLEIWEYVKSSEYSLSSEESAFLFKMFNQHHMKYFPSNDLNIIYDGLTLEMKRDFNIRCYNILHLVNNQRYEEAVKDFEGVLEMDRNEDISASTWRNAVIAAYHVEPSLGDTMLRKMKDSLVVPNNHMLQTLFYYFVNLKDCSRAEKILHLMINKHRGYLNLVPLWAEYGMLHKLEEARELRMVEKDVILQAKAVILVKNNEDIKAREILSELSGIRRVYVVMLLTSLCNRGQSLEDWKELLCTCGVPLRTFNTMVFFTYIECGHHDEAKAFREQMEELCPMEVDIRMQSPHAEHYKEFLAAYNISMENNVTSEEAVRTTGRASLLDHIFW